MNERELERKKERERERKRGRVRERVRDMRRFERFREILKLGNPIKCERAAVDFCVTLKTMTLFLDPS